MPLHHLIDPENFVDMDRRSSAARSIADIVSSIRVLAGAWDRANSADAYPAEQLDHISREGGLCAFRTLPDQEAVDGLITVLRLVGGADLSLGRIFEGHVNASQLIAAYGDPAQRATLLTDLAAGRIYGVWNTEPRPGMSLERDKDSWLLHGAKSYASGAGHVDRALITAQTPTGAKQLVVVDVSGRTERANNDGWRVSGMRGSCSGLFDFEGMRIGADALIGQPGDYEREPRFSAGAWRFTAVQLGAVETLLRHVRDHLVSTGKATDPIYRARFARCVVETRSAGLWVERAARLAEAADDDAVPFVLMTRGIVEDAALKTMEAAARSVGTAAFYEDSRIDRITRDLGLYLRQPVPDQARDRAAAAWLQRDCWGDNLWW